jgi:hypothetical protein
MLAPGTPGSFPAEPATTHRSFDASVTLFGGDHPA